MRRVPGLQQKILMSLKPLSCAYHLAAASLVALIAPSGELRAQTAIRMTTTQQTSCVATTDAQGLRLVPGSADLQASGVTLSGTGCGTQTAPSEDFQAIVNVPATATVGTPFNVSWTAGSAATACTLGGATTGVSGWNSGAKVCSGAACSDPHSVAVTINTPGSYSFSVTCTNSTGYAVGAVNAGGGAPIPANFQLTGPSSANVGQTFDIGWEVQGATECNAAATRDGTAVTLPGWNDGNTSTTSPRHVTANAQGTYTLTMRCGNTVGNVDSAPKTITVSSVSSCPAGLQESANVAYTISLSPALATDVRVFDNVWGRNVSNGEIVPWPGRNFVAFPTNYDKTKYISAKFHVPATGLSPTLNGALKYSDDLAGPRITTSISTTCGEFNPANLGQGCLTTNQWKNNTIAKWKLTSGNPSLVACALTPGQDYYLNIKTTDPSISMPACSGNSCKLGVINSWGTN